VTVGDVVAAGAVRPSAPWRGAPKTVDLSRGVAAPDCAPKGGQLLTQRHVLECGGPVSATDQPERSKQHDNRSQHALSCRAIDLRINWRGWRSGSGEAQTSGRVAGCPTTSSAIPLPSSARHHQPCHLALLPRPLPTCAAVGVNLTVPWRVLSLRMSQALPRPGARRLHSFVRQASASCPPPLQGCGALTRWQTE
jgi:hypothetical protein